jgi:hypothetical protein
MSSDGDFWRQVKANHQEEYLRISNPANSLLSYSIDGESMSWTEYKQYLLNVIKDADARLAVAEPFELEQRGVT